MRDEYFGHRRRFIPPLGQMLGGHTPQPSHEIGRNLQSRCACGVSEIDMPRCGNEKQPPTRSRIEGCLIDVWRVLRVALPTTCPKCQAGKSHAQQTHRSRFWHGVIEVVIGQRKGEFIVQRIPRSRRTEILE